MLVKIGLHPYINKWLSSPFRVEWRIKLFHITYHYNYSLHQTLIILIGMIKIKLLKTGAKVLQYKNGQIDYLLSNKNYFN